MPIRSRQGMGQASRTLSRARKRGGSFEVAGVLASDQREACKKVDRLIAKSTRGEASRDSRVSAGNSRVLKTALKTALSF